MLMTFLSLLTMVFPCCGNAEAIEQYALIEDQAKVPILTPSLSRSKTLKIRLQNGLEAVLVSDPDTDKSAASMTVKVGSWDDPGSSPGLAHFTEHMLFLGTKKYPLESDYDRFITQNGGASNAFTTNAYTAYVFDVDHSAFPEALDRFSSFFKEPLFNSSGVSRELHAIDQEYAKNLENDDFREMAVFKELSLADHPNHGFSSGNLASLSGVSQKTLQDWYRNHYSAGLMRLMVVSPLPLEKLKEMVVEDFKDVPSPAVQPYRGKGPIFNPENREKIVYIESVKDIRALTLFWELPPRFAEMKDSKPDSIICYLLGDEGKESLLAQLKREDLAEGIQSGSVQLGAENKILLVDINLTNHGVKELYTVIERVFQALASYKKTGIPPYFIEEMQKIEKLNYQYQPREDIFENMMKQASWLANEDIDTYPERTRLIARPDSASVEELLNELIPKNCYMDLVAPESISGVKGDRKEPWLGVSYAVRPIPEEVLKKWEDALPHPGIHVPASNPYIPFDLSLKNEGVDKSEKQASGILPFPVAAVKNDEGLVYFAQDKKYLTPNIAWMIEIKTPYIETGDAEKVVLGDLLVKDLEESLKSETYPAGIAGLDYSLKRTDNGISVEITGFSEKAPVLLGHILKHFQSWQPSREGFKLYKDYYMREYQNFEKEMPVTQAIEQAKKVLYQKYTTNKEKLGAIRKITFEKFQEFGKTVFSKRYIQGVLYGNLTGREAEIVAKDVFTAFPGTVYPKDEHYKPVPAVFPENQGPFYVEGKTKAQGNAVVLMIESVDFSFKKRAAQQVLMQGMSDPFFATLRTKQQTGYIVRNTSEDIERRLFDFFAVQSNTHATRDLLARFELFIEGYLQEIKIQLPEESFEKIRSAAVFNLQNPVNNVKEMAAILNLLAFRYEGAFDWLDKRVQALKDLTYEETIEIAKRSLGKSNRRRFAFLLNGDLPEEMQFHYKRLPNIQKFRDLSSYKDYSSEAASSPGLLNEKSAKENR